MQTLISDGVKLSTIVTNFLVKLGYILANLSSKFSITSNFQDGFNHHKNINKPNTMNIKVSLQ